MARFNPGDKVRIASSRQIDHGHQYCSQNARVLKTCTNGLGTPVVTVWNSTLGKEMNYNAASGMVWRR